MPEYDEGIFGNVVNVKWNDQPMVITNITPDPVNFSSSITISGQNFPDNSFDGFLIIRYDPTLPYGTNVGGQFTTQGNLKTVYLRPSEINWSSSSIVVDLSAIKQQGFDSDLMFNVTSVNMISVTVVKYIGNILTDPDLPLYDPLHTTAGPWDFSAADFLGIIPRTELSNTKFITYVLQRLEISRTYSVTSFSSSSSGDGDATAGTDTGTWGVYQLLGYVLHEYLWTLSLTIIYDNGDIETILNAEQVRASFSTYHTSLTGSKTGYSAFKSSVTGAASASGILTGNVATTTYQYGTWGGPGSPGIIFDEPISSSGNSPIFRDYLAAYR